MIEQKKNLQPIKNSSVVTQVTNQPEKKEDKPYVISNKIPNSNALNTGNSRLPATSVNTQMKKKLNEGNIIS